MSFEATAPFYFVFL